MSLQLLTLAVILLGGLVALALVYVVGMRAEVAARPRPAHPTPASGHQSEADAIGRHARSVRLGDPAPGTDLGSAVRDARRGGGRRRRLRDRAGLWATDALAPERAGQRVRHHRPRGAHLPGRPAGGHPGAGGRDPIHGRRSAQLPTARGRPGASGPPGRSGGCPIAGRRSGSGRRRLGSSSEHDPVDRGSACRMKRSRPRPQAAARARGRVPGVDA